MILVSEKNNNYNDFDWQSYSNNYRELATNGFITKDHLWWHYINIGEKNNYKFYNIYETQIQDKNEKTLNTFDDILYDLYYHHLKMEGFITKEQLFWHYSNIGEKKGYTFFHINQRNENINIWKECNQLKLLDIPNTSLIHSYYSISIKPTIYYYIGHTCQDSIRTGIQIVSIYLAREYINNDINYQIDVIFVKWDDVLKAIVPCSSSEIYFFFNYNETSDIIEMIEYTNYDPIHLNKSKPLLNCKFFCPELTFVQYKTLPRDLNLYLNTHKLYSIYILYDIIPLVIPEYSLISNDFTSYLNENLLNANKVITISDFTKQEFLNYTNNINLPKLVSIKLPYQYRNKRRIKPKKNIQDKVTILLPGTIEPRKQQILLMKLFIKFIKQNPHVNVELITFGNVVYLCKNDLEQCICESNGQITYLGIIDNETLFNLYKQSTFLCFISKYEGYGFPISESLWHGMPVLTSTFGSMAEVASCGGCYCVDTTNETHIYNALNELIKNPNIIEKLKNEINSNAFTNWSTYSECIYNEIMKQ